jgi:phospholipase/carboxylesterase
MLHGRGADEEDLLGLASYLDERLAVVSARAPYPFEYGGGFTWYDIDETGVPDPEMFRTSYDRLTAFVKEVLDGYPIDRSNLFLLGFSMGSMLSFSLALTRPELFRGVIANSGYVPEGTDLVLRWNELASTAFFIAHGTFDPVIPVGLGRRTRDQFQTSNASWVYREYPMGHEISPESLTDAAQWLKELLDNQQDNP